MKAKCVDEGKEEELLGLFKVVVLHSEMKEGCDGPFGEVNGRVVEMLCENFRSSYLGEEMV